LDGSQRPKKRRGKGERDAARNGRRKMKTWKTRNGSQITRVLAGRSNVFLLSSGEKYILIDTSPGRRWKKLDRRLRRLKVGRLEALILTHSHYDHAGCAARVKDKYKAWVFAHREEGSFLAKGENAVIRGTILPTRLLVDHLAKYLAPLVSYQPCRPDVLVEGKFRLDEFGFDAYLLPTPGHSPGSMSVIVDDEIAVVGDAMFGVFPGSVFPPYAADTGRMVESWGKLLAAPCRLFLPAHGPENSRRLVWKEYVKRSGRGRGESNPNRVS